MTQTTQMVINGVTELDVTTLSGTSVASIVRDTMTLTLRPPLTVHQVAHGFTTGQAVYWTGSTWALAKADVATTLGVAVASVLDVDNFIAFFTGNIEGLSGLTAGNFYFVSDITAGLLTSTEPTTIGHFSNPLMLALSTTTGFVLEFRASQIASPLINIVTKTANYTAVAQDFILCDTSAGGFTVTLPLSASNGSRNINVKKISTDTNTLTVGITGGDNIDGPPTLLIVVGKTEVGFLADGTTVWEIF